VLQDKVLSRKDLKGYGVVGEVDRLGSKNSSHIQNLTTDINCSRNLDKHQFSFLKGLVCDVLYLYTE
jgi:hypothetical protein